MAEIDDVALLKRRVLELEAELEAHKQEQAMMRALLEAIPDVVIRVGADAHIEFINRVLPEYAGAPLVGQSIFAFAPPDQHEVMRRAFEAAFATGQVASFESIALAPDGTRDWYASRFAPIRDQERLLGLVLVSSNVTRIRENEAALRDRDAQLRVALDAGNVGVWRWDAVDDAVHWDEKLCAMFGLEPGQGPRTREAFLALTPPDQTPGLAAHIERALTTGAYPDFQLRVDVPGGTRWFIIKGGTIRDASGRVVSLVGGVIDDTDRRRIEQQLLQAQKLDAVGQLSTGVAHNFNNMLACIMPALELASGTASAKDRRFLEIALESAHQAAGLVRELMTFSRGRAPTQSATEPLEAVLVRTLELARRTFDRRIAIQLSGLATSRPMAVDGSVLEQVLMNLLLNARDALDGLEGERVAIEVSIERLSPSAVAARLPATASGEFVEIRVRDRGTGMDEATRKRIFEPFFTTKAVGKGTGLGLWSAWAMVTGLGGTIECESRPDLGTTFSVLLPVTVRSDDPERAPIEAVLGGGGKRVLVVDDELLVLSSTAALLRAFGFDVTEASSGAGAVERARLERFDVVLLDFSMPGQSAAVTLSELRALRPGLPIVCFSGLGVELEGANENLTKPATAKALVDALNRVTSAR